MDYLQKIYGLLLLASVLVAHVMKLSIDVAMAAVIWLMFQ